MGLNGKNIKGLRGAETLKLVRSASPSVRIEGFVLCETLCLGVFVAYLVFSLGNTRTLISKHKPPTAENFDSRI